MNTPISKSVDRFVELVLLLEDADLDKEWTWGSYKSEGIRFAYFRTYEELRQLAVRCGQWRHQSGLPLSEVQRILGHYHAAYMDLQAVLLGVDRQYDEKPPIEGEWPIRRVMAHIVGADMGFYVAIKFAVDRYRAGEDPLVEIDDGTWLGIIGMEDEQIEALMAEPLPGLRAFHDVLHQRILADFADIRENELDKPSQFWEDETHSIRFRLHRFDAHMRQHTIQIEKNLHTLGYVPSESKLLLRLIFSAQAELEGMLLGLAECPADLIGETAESIDRRTSEVEANLVDQNGIE